MKEDLLICSCNGEVCTKDIDCNECCQDAHHNKIRVLGYFRHRKAVIYVGYLEYRNGGHLYTKEPGQCWEIYDNDVKPCEIPKEISLMGGRDTYKPLFPANIQSKEKGHILLNAGINYKELPVWIRKWLYKEDRGITHCPKRHILVSEDGKGPEFSMWYISSVWGV